jgi:hypothetical protein
MQFNKVIISLVAGLSFALSGHAQTTNILDWQFNTSDNPAEPNWLTSVNPDGGDPDATFTGSSINYSFFPRPGFGEVGGTWEIDFGQLQLAMNRSAKGPVSYTLEVYQFIDTGRAFYPGALSLSPAGSQFVSEKVYVPQTGDMLGAWYVDTYSWSSVNLDPTISLGITGAGGNPILLDEVKLTIVGNLTLVPEPGSGLIAVIGLLVLGVRSWFRKRA